MTGADTDHRRRFHGRRHGRRLRPGRRRLLRSLLPEIEIRIPDAGADAGAIDLNTLFAKSIRTYGLEIGFGGGEHLAVQAANHPSVGFIGCEPFINGVASLLARISEAGLANIRIFTDDARLLLDMLPEAAIGRAYLLFPDPWPKKRHAKRRFISAATAAGLARVLADGAEFRVASDSASYIRRTLLFLARRPEFDWIADGPSDWRQRCAGWPETRYEKKALADGRPCTYLRFRRTGRGGPAGAMKSVR